MVVRWLNARRTSEAGMGRQAPRSRRGKDGGVRPGRPAAAHAEVRKEASEMKDAR